MENNIMQNKERETLHKAIWNIAENLRGSVEGLGFQVIRPWYYVLPLYFRVIRGVRR